MVTHRHTDTQTHRLTCQILTQPVQGLGWVKSTFNLITSTEKSLPFLLITQSLYVMSLSYQYNLYNWKIHHRKRRGLEIVSWRWSVQYNMV